MTTEIVTYDIESMKMNNRDVVVLVIDENGIEHCEQRTVATI